jgi:hypothetical protein
MSCLGTVKNTYEILVGKSERKRPLIRPRRRWEDKSETDIRQIWCVEVDWICMVQDERGFVNTIRNPQVP